jgi:hypothetical protein
LNFCIKQVAFGVYELDAVLAGTVPVAIVDVTFAIAAWHQPLPCGIKKLNTSHGFIVGSSLRSEP